MTPICATQGVGIHLVQVPNDFYNVQKMLLVFEMGGKYLVNITVVFVNTLGDFQNAHILNVYYF